MGTINTSTCYLCTLVRGTAVWQQGSRGSFIIAYSRTPYTVPSYGPVEPWNAAELQQCARRIVSYTCSSYCIIYLALVNSNCSTQSFQLSLIFWCIIQSQSRVPPPPHPRWLDFISRLTADSPPTYTFNRKTTNIRYVHNSSYLTTSIRSNVPVVPGGIQVYLVVVCTRYLNN